MVYQKTQQFTTQIYNKLNLNTAETFNQRIVFFGTPDFAAASLESLIEANFNIVGVVTSLDREGKHKSDPRFNFSQVKKACISLNEEKELNIPILQPASMKSPDFIEALRALEADIFVVVAFRMMPEIVWNMPPMGTINLHGSLLPKYRGAAPINWAIINGEKETGITTFKLKHAIDTGDILLQKVIPILNTDNAGTLHDKMMWDGAELLVETIKGVFENTIKEIPQKNVETIYASKLFKHNTVIDWNKSTFEINNFIRGLSPYPSAYILLGNKNLKIFESHSNQELCDLPTGVMETDNKTYLKYSGTDGWVYIDSLQLEGKNKINIKDFLNGYKF